MPQTPKVERPADTEVSTPSRHTKVIEPYVRMTAAHIYFWAWPMVNIWNRRLAFEQASELCLMNGALPFAPINALSMLHDYIVPEQRWVACPNQDVVYGGSIAALDRSPVVLQVPDFGDRFWVYEGVDLRTDGFLKLGSMYGSKAGFYLVVGPDWNEETPPGITQVFRCPGQTAMFVPRVFMDDSDTDRTAVQELIAGLDVYPLDRFDGTPTRHDWRQLPKIGGAVSGSEETKWVLPETFFDQLGDVLADVPPRPGEAALYAEAHALLDAIGNNPVLKAAATDAATKSEAEVVTPLLQFREWGIDAGNHWSTIVNGAVFGEDYFTRTAVARSNILVNAASETVYMYLDLDAEGARLNGGNRYEVTFAPGQLPPVDGFWSLTLYDEHHFFVPNPIRRYSLGTKNKSLQPGADGALTILIQSESPGADHEGNWLPSPTGADFTLYLRAYGPEPAIIEGSWTPPAVRKMG